MKTVVPIANERKDGKRGGRFGSVLDQPVVSVRHTHSYVSPHADPDRSASSALLLLRDKIAFACVGFVTDM